MRKASAALWVCLLLVCSCGPAAPSSEARTFEVRGRVEGLRFEGKAVRITHEHIPDFMESMTMDLPLADPEEGSRLRPGDKIRFRLLAGEDGLSIDQIQLLPPDTPLRLHEMSVQPPADGSGDRR